METIQDVLESCKVEGNLIKMPEEQIERKLYTKVQKVIVNLGGKWKGGKTFGFVFDSDPTDLLTGALAGDRPNIKKDFQFFGTPSGLAKEMVELADIQRGENVLEPSAGWGAIVEHICEVDGYHRIYMVEIQESSRKRLINDFPAEDMSEIGDFLEYDWPEVIDVIIANPPFAKNQDIDHIYKMYEGIRQGGRIVTLSSPHWAISSNKKEMMFQTFLKLVNAKVTDIPQGTFKGSGTNIGAKLIQMTKL